MTSPHRRYGYRPVFVLAESDPEHGYPWVLVVHTDARRQVFPAMTRQQAASYLVTGQFAPDPDERMVFEIVLAEWVTEDLHVDVEPYLALETSRREHTP